MGLFEQYQEEMKNDTTFDATTVTEYQMKLPAIKHKWAARLINTKIALRSKESLLWRARKTLMDKGLTDAKVKLTKIAISNNIEDHDTILKIKEQIEEDKLLVEYLEKSEKILSSITYDIKNLTELMKLEQL